MSELYYCTENDEFLTVQELKEFYNESGKDTFDSFSDYISACMTQNGGTLQMLQTRENSLKNKLLKLSYSEEDIETRLVFTNDLYKLYQFKWEHERREEK